MQRIKYVWIVLLLSVIFSSMTYALSLPCYPLPEIRPQIAFVKNGQIEYYKFGHGTPIVLVGGYAVNISTWDSRFLATLAKKHTVIIFDNRNVGGTIIHSSSYTSKDLANDLYALLQQLKISQTDVLGFSMGGMIAQQFAVLHPQSIKHLILLNTAMAGEAAVVPNDKVKNIMFHLPTNPLLVYAKTWDLFFPADQKIKIGIVAAEYHFRNKHYPEKGVTPEVIRKQQKLLLAWQEDNATMHKITKLKMPVLILNGGKDAIIPPINSDILAQNISDTTLVRWKDGGHGMIYQHPYELAKAVNEFLAPAIVK